MTAKANLFVCLIASVPAHAGVTFEDWSDTLPSEHVYRGGWEHFVGGGVAVFDCNGDTYPDLWAAGGEAPSVLLLNDLKNSGRFVLADDDAAVLDRTVGAYPIDLNNDGHLDLFVLRVGSNRALLGDGECGFRDATAELGLPDEDRWSTAFSATWEDNRAFPTLAIGNYVDRSDPDGPFEACDLNTIYRASDEHYDTHLELEPGYCALSMLFSDWTRAGRRDLRISNDRHYYVRGGSEQMWRPDTQSFLTTEDDWDEISIWGMGIASRDINGDARPDVVLTSMGDQLLQLSSDRARFVAAPYEIGTYAQRPHAGDDGRPATGWHAEFGDIDNDGLDDLFIAKGNVDQMPSNAMFDPNNLLLQRHDGRFDEVSVTAGVATGDRSRGAALADFDLDGRLDLVVVNRRAPMELYRNVTNSVGGFVALTPRLTDLNTGAIGAWVEVRHPNGRVSLQEVTVGGGHAGGQAGPLHFGVGDAVSVEVRVSWPDGSVSDWSEIPANTRAEISPGHAGDLRVLPLAVDR